MTIIIGLAGYRRVGKSEVGNRLVEAHGFKRIHPFNGGKAACRAYFTHLGVSPEDAVRMTDGDLKDTPSEYLPDNQTPRYLMERFGKFMGVEMGPDWTIGRELIRATEGGADRLLVESVVYEDSVLRSQGATIWKVTRPTVAQTPGLETDTYTRSMVTDHEIINDGSIKELCEKIDAAVEAHVAAMTPCLEPAGP